MSFPDPQPKALFFDVFGTCVDWRTTVTDALESACSQALNRASSSIATRIRMKTDALVCIRSRLSRSVDTDIDLSVQARLG